MPNEISQRGIGNIALSDIRDSNITLNLAKKSSLPYPFKLIWKVHQLFGRSDRSEAFAPSLKEFREGLVHRSILSDKVEARLATHGWAWVRGRGAAGKTVLAIQIALGYEAKSYPAYYLNLATTEVEIAEAFDALTAFTNEQVLFIIDNVHLNEDFAREVFDFWQENARGSLLLLLGRATTLTDERGLSNPLEDLQAEALTLTVNPDDLTGVFHRIARKIPFRTATFPTPPAIMLQQWQKLFGGDLIAFSAAVARRINQLTMSDWQLQPQDAANYVREQYLDKANEAERTNLLRMAVVAELEYPMPVDQIYRTDMRDLLRSGVAYRAATSRNGKHDYYHLIHAGLGELLLTALGYSTERLIEFKTIQLCSIVQQSPFIGENLIRALEVANRKQEAITVLQSIVELDQSTLSAFYTLGFQSLPMSCERLVSFGLLSTYEIDQKLSKQPLALSQAALRTPLGDLVTFLNYAERKLPLVFAELQRTLAQPDQLSALNQAALRTPLDSLVTFLNYAERKLPLVFAELQRTLVQPEQLSALNQAALRTPLDHLATFLNYAEVKLPLVFTELQQSLAESQSINILAQTACRAGFTQLLGFLRSTDIAFEVLAAIDREEWDRVRLTPESVLPDFFHSLSKELQRLGKPELAEAPARALIHSAVPQHWHTHVIMLLHLSQVLRLGQAAGTVAITQFLDRIVTPHWLEQQYTNASSGSIASTLFGIWGNCEYFVFDYFRLSSLTSRLNAEMKKLSKRAPEDISAALQLLGTSTLLGVKANNAHAKWPEQVRDTIRFAAPRAGMLTIGYIQIQLWLGLREMARLRSDRVVVPAKAGEQILTLWKNSKGYNDKQQRLNIWMIDWLERCKKSDWVLVPDNSQLITPAIINSG